MRAFKGANIDRLIQSRQAVDIQQLGLITHNDALAEQMPDNLMVSNAGAFWNQASEDIQIFKSFG